MKQQFMENKNFIGFKTSSLGSRQIFFVGKSACCLHKGPRFIFQNLGQLTTSYNSSSRASSTLFWLPYTPALTCCSWIHEVRHRSPKMNLKKHPRTSANKYEIHACTDTQTHTHAHMLVDYTETTKQCLFHIEHFSGSHVFNWKRPLHPALIHNLKS